MNTCSHRVVQTCVDDFSNDSNRDIGFARVIVRFFDGSLDSGFKSTA